MFIYVTDTNKYSWSINVNRVVKVTEHNYVTLIYFDNEDIIKTNERMLDLVARLNNA